MNETDLTWQSAPLVRLRDVTKDYYLEGKSLRVLRGLTLDVRPGEIVVIVGSSGAGKSTLLHVIGGLDVASSGEVEIAGRRIDTMGSSDLADFRNKYVGFVFQFHHLLPEFTAEENVAMPLLIRGVGKADARREATRYLDMVGLPERRAHKPAELSGGEQQRVAVARALVTRPTLILADEPSGNLDSENGERLHALLRDISRSEGQTFVIVTHNADLASRADRVLTMRDGVLIDG